MELNSKAVNLSDAVIPVPAFEVWIENVRSMFYQHLYSNSQRCQRYKTVLMAFPDIGAA